jgi:putative two-component system response regulator
MVADVVEAMMSHRPYRAGLGQKAALEEIEAGAGTLYDAEVVACCTRAFRERGFAFSEE